MSPCVPGHAPCKTLRADEQLYWNGLSDLGQGGRPLEALRRVLVRCVEANDGGGAQAAALLEHGHLLALRLDELCAKGLDLALAHCCLAARELQTTQISRSQ